MPLAFSQMSGLWCADVGSLENTYCWYALQALPHPRHAFLQRIHSAVNLQQERRVSEDTDSNIRDPSMWGLSIQLSEMQNDDNRDPSGCSHACM